jgi:hypothetical protein
MVIESICGKNENFSTSTRTSLRVVKIHFKIGHIHFCLLLPMSFLAFTEGKLVNVK